MADKDGVKVYIRSRPLNQREEKEEVFWEVSANNIKTKTDVEKQKAYNFDKVFDETFSTKELFNEVTKPVIDKAMQGFNATIFAYGQTSSGKTFTMLGTDHSPGIIPLSVKHIFDCIQETPNREYLLRVSYLEIYNENLRDLLNSETLQLKIREDEKKSIYVSNLKEVFAASYDDVMSEVMKGQKKRVTAATGCNADSSRSHSIFRVIIESRKRDLSDDIGDSDKSVWITQLNMVDLAGSERVNQARTEGVRLAEGSFINKSLSTLCRVIDQISSETGRYISFRDSNLTRYLQSSLGGNSLTSIICTVTLASLEETDSTLRFASNAKRVKNTPKLNEVLSEEACIHKQKIEIKKLKRRISELKKQMELSNLKTKEGEEEKLHLITDFEERLEGMVGMVLVSSRQKETQSRRMTWCPNTQTSSVGVRMKLGNLTNMIDLNKCDDGFTKGDIFFGQRNKESPAMSSTITKRPARSSCEIEKKRMKKLSAEPLHNTLFTDRIVPEKESESKDERYRRLLKDFQQLSEKKKEHEEMVTENTLLTQQNVQYKNESEQYLKRINLQNEQIEEMKRQLEQYKGDTMMTLRNEKACLEHQLNSALSETLQHQQISDEYSEKMLILQKEVQRLTEDAEKAENDKEGLQRRFLQVKNQTLEAVTTSLQSPDTESRIVNVQSSGSLDLGPDLTMMAENTQIQQLTEQISNLSKSLEKEQETSVYLSNEHLIHLDQLAIQQNEIKNLQDSISAKNRKIEELKNENEFFFAKFQPETENEVKQIKDLMLQVKNHEKSFQETQQIFLDTNKKLSEMTSEKQLVDELAKKQKVEIENLKCDVESFRAMLEISSVKMNPLQHSICETKDTESAEEVGASLQDELKQADQETIINLMNQLKEVESELTNKQSQLEKKEQELKDEKESHMTLLSELDLLKAQNEREPRQEEKVLSAVETCDMNTSSIKFLSTDRQVQTEMVEDIWVEEQMKDLKNEMLAAKSHLESEKEKNNCLQMEVSKLQTDNQQLATQINNMEAAHDERDVAEGMLAAYKKEIEELSAENISLKKNADQVKDALLAESNKEMHLIQKLEESETSKRSIDEDWSRERARANKEIEELNLKLNETKKMLLKVESEKDITDQLRNRLQSELDELKSQKTHLETVASSRSSDADKLVNEKLGRVQAEKEAESKKVEELKEELMITSEKLVQQMKLVEEKKIRLNDVECTYRCQLNDINEVVSDCKEQITMLQDQLKSLNDSEDQAEIKIKDLQDEVKQKMEVIVKLKEVETDYLKLMSKEMTSDCSQTEESVVSCSEDVEMMEDITKKNEELEQNFILLYTKHEEVEKRYSVLQDENQMLIEKQILAENDLESLKGDVKSKMDECINLQATIEELKDQKIDLNKQMDELRNQIASHDDTIAICREELAAYVEMKSNLEKQLSDANTRVTSIEKDLEKANDVNAEALKTFNHNLMIRLKEQETDLKQQMIEDKEKEIKIREEAEKKWEEVIQEKQGHIEELHQQIAKLSDDLSICQSQLDESHKKYSVYEEEMIKIKRIQDEEVKRLRLKIESEQEEIDQLNKKLEATKKEQANKGAVDVDALKNEIEDLELSVKRMNNCVKCLETEREVLENEIKDYKKEFEGKDAELVRLQELSNKLQVKYDELVVSKTEENERFLVKKDLLEAKVDDLTSSLSDVKKVKEDLMVKNRELQSSLDDMKICASTEVDFNRRFSLLEDTEDLSESEKQYIILYSNYNQELENKATLENRIKHLEHVVCDHERSATLAQKQCEDAVGKEKVASGVVDELREEIKGAEEEIKSLKYEVVRKSQECELIQIEIKEKVAELENSAREKDSLKKRVDQIEEDYERLRLDEGAKKIEMIKLRDQLDEAQQECERLSKMKPMQQVDSAQVEELKAALAEAEQKNAAVVEEFLAKTKTLREKFHLDTQKMEQRIRRDTEEEKKKTTDLEMKLFQTNVQVESLEKELREKEYQERSSSLENKRLRLAREKESNQKMQALEEVESSKKKIEELHKALAEKESETEKVVNEEKEKTKMSMKELHQLKDKLVEKDLKLKSSIQNDEQLKKEIKYHRENYLAKVNELNEMTNLHHQLKKEFENKIQGLQQMKEANENECLTLKQKIEFFQNEIVRVQTESNSSVNELRKLNSSLNKQLELKQNLSKVDEVPSTSGNLVKAESKRKINESDNQPEASKFPKKTEVKKKEDRIEELKALVEKKIDNFKKLFDFYESGINTSENRIWKFNNFAKVAERTNDAGGKEIVNRYQTGHTDKFADVVASREIVIKDFNSLLTISNTRRTRSAASHLSPHLFLTTPEPTHDASAQFDWLRSKARCLKQLNTYFNDNGERLNHIRNYFVRADRMVTAHISSSDIEEYRLECGGQAEKTVFPKILHLFETTSTK